MFSNLQNNSNNIHSDASNLYFSVSIGDGILVKANEICHNKIALLLKAKKDEETVRLTKKQKNDIFSIRQDQILRFVTNPEVPFDNNQAERDLRMIKMKQ